MSGIKCRRNSGRRPPWGLWSREKQPSFSGCLSKLWGSWGGGLRGLSVTVTQGCAERAGIQGWGQGCVRMQVRQTAMWSGIFPTQLREHVDPGVHHAANTCQCDLEWVLICNWHPATLLSFPSPGTGTALPHSLPWTVGAALLLAHGLLTLSEKGHREEQLALWLSGPAGQCLPPASCAPSPSPRVH